MWKWLFIPLLSTAVLAQNPALPTSYVNNNEMWDGSTTTPTYEFTLTSSTWSNGPPAGCTFHLPYASTGAGINSALADMEACRTQTSQCSILDIPAGDYAVTGTGIIYPQTNTAVATCFNIVRSSDDALLPDGQTVCAHGIRDNIASNVGPITVGGVTYPYADIGLYNPDCTGENMYDSYGPSQNNTPPSSSPFPPLMHVVSASISGTTATFVIDPPPAGAVVTPGQYVKSVDFSPVIWNTTWQILSYSSATQTLTAQACLSIYTGGACADDTVINTAPVTDVFNLTAVSIQNTASPPTATFTGTITNGGSNAFAGDTVVVAGFSNDTNNGSFLVDTSSGTNFTVQIDPTASGNPVAESCPGNPSVCSGGSQATATLGQGFLLNHQTIYGLTSITVNTTTISPTYSTTAGGNNYIMLKNGYVSPGMQIQICIPAQGDTGCTAEMLTTQGGPNSQGMIVTTAHPHVMGEHVQGPVTALNTASCVNTGCTYALRNGQSINTANYNDRAHMWRLTSDNANSPTLQFCQGAGTNNFQVACTSAIGPDHWLVEDAEVTHTAGTKMNVDTLDVGAGGPFVPSQLATHIHLRKLWAHGDWTCLYCGAIQVANSFNIQGNFISVVDSQASQNLRAGMEGHNLVPGKGFGPFKVVHNWMEGQSIGYICGGYEADAQPLYADNLNFSACTNMEVRRNHWGFPYSWIGFTAIQLYTNQHMTGANGLARKNIVEQKGSLHSIRQGNIGENSDQSGGQNGTIGDFNVWGGAALITGEVTTNGTTTVTWASNGTNLGQFQAGNTITINGVNYIVAAPGGNNSLTTTTAVPAGTALPYRAGYPTFGGSMFRNTMQDIYEDSNIYRNICTGYEAGFRGQSFSTPLAAPTATGTGGGSISLGGRVWYHNNLIYNVTNQNPGCGSYTTSGTPLGHDFSAFQMQMTGHMNRDSTGTINTMLIDCATNLDNGSGCTPNMPTNFTQSNIKTGDYVRITGCTDSSFNTGYGAFPFNGISPPGVAQVPLDGVATLTGTNGDQVSGLTVVYPNNGTGTANVTQAASSVSATISGSTATFTHSTAWPTSGFVVGGYLYSNGFTPADWNGQIWTITALTTSAPYTLTATFIGTTPPAENATATGSIYDESCSISYSIDAPHALQYSHNTLVDVGMNFAVSFATSRPNVYPVPSVGKETGNVVNQGGAFVRDSLFRDNLYVGGAFQTSANGEGTPTEVYNLDMTSLTFDNQVFVGRTGTLYTQFGNNPLYASTPACLAGSYVQGVPGTTLSDIAGCVVPAGGCTGTGGTGTAQCTLYFPTYATMCGYWANQAGVCTTGLVNGPNGTPQNNQTGDYHNWQLATTSPYAAGGANQASDGTDLGANITAIDAAQLSNGFTCPTWTTCPGPGPYADVFAGQIIPPVPTPIHIQITPGARLNGVVIR